jgi:hypothetical protein
MNVHPKRAQALADRPGERGLQAWQQTVEGLHDRHLDPELCERRPELNPDVAASDDGEARRRLREGECSRRVEDLLSVDGQPRKLEGT